MRYALVENGVVTNIIEMDKRNEQFFPSAVYTGDRPVGMGDTYTEGKFYRDGKEVLTALEEANNEIDSLTQQLGEAALRSRGHDRPRRGSGARRGADESHDLEDAKSLAHARPSDAERRGELAFGLQPVAGAEPALEQVALDLVEYDAPRACGRSPLRS